MIHRNAVEMIKRKKEKREGQKGGERNEEERRGNSNVLSSPLLSLCCSTHN
jgi:hypothetical protein